jgi:hypothetical protein
VRITLRCVPDTTAISARLARPTIDRKPARPSTRRVWYDADGAGADALIVAALASAALAVANEFAGTAADAIEVDGVAWAADAIGQVGVGWTAKANSSLGAGGTVTAAGRSAGDCIVRAARPCRSATAEQKAAEEEKNTTSDWILWISHDEAKAEVNLSGRKNK